MPKAPDLDIAPVLEDLGAENVPRVLHGHRKMSCFLHEDKTWSASVSRYGYRCFSCGTTGDAIALLMKLEARSYQDAVRRATELNGGVDPAVAQGDGDRQRWWNGDLFT